MAEKTSKPSPSKPSSKTSRKPSGKTVSTTGRKKPSSSPTEVKSKPNTAAKKANTGKKPVSKAQTVSRAELPVKKKSTKAKAVKASSRSEKAPAESASVKSAPAKKASAKKVPSKKASASKKKVGVKKAGTNGSEAERGVSAATTLSAAAKRIQERERLRKKRLSDRISERVAARAAANGNGHRPSIAAVKKVKPLTDRDLNKFRNLLLEFRERIVGDISFLTDDSLHRAGRDTGADLSGASQHSADHGTDNFDREFALSLATSEQDVLYEVDEALQRIEEGSYGICEMTGVYIEKARLEVIPYTRYSVQAQAKMEQGRARYRPFAQAFRGW